MKNRKTMKKLVIFCCTILFLASCKEDEIPVPTGLYIEETALELVAEGETYNNRVYTTSSFLDVTVSEDSKEWLSAKIENKYLIITVERNESIGIRNGVITIEADMRSETVSVRQVGLPTRQLEIESVTTNSQQTTSGNESAQATIDNDVNTFWHTSYSLGHQNSVPVYWVTYTLATGVPSIDMADLTLRYNGGSGSNGLFGPFGIWVKGDGTDVDTSDPDDTDDSGAVAYAPAPASGGPAEELFGWAGKIGSVDADGFKLVYKGDGGKKYAADPVVVNCVILPVTNPTEVRIRFAGSDFSQSPIYRYSVGGFITMAEVAFFGKVG
jgi:hypothetical protein